MGYSMKSLIIVALMFLSIIGVSLATDEPDVPMRAHNSADIGAFNFSLLECLENHVLTKTNQKVFYVIKEMEPDLQALTMHNLSYNNRYFIVLINSNILNSRKDFIITMAHEFVHIQQYQQNRISADGKGIYFDGVRQDNKPYNAREVEIEAFDKTEQMIIDISPCIMKNAKDNDEL